MISATNERMIANKKTEVFQRECKNGTKVTEFVALYHGSMSKIHSISVTIFSDEHVEIEPGQAYLVDGELVENVYKDKDDKWHRNHRLVCTRITKDETGGSGSATKVEL